MIKTNVDRKLEHLGDAVLGLAARLIADQVHNDADPVKDYFKFATALATNSNLRTAGFQSGFEAELKIGKTFKDDGLPAAMIVARDILGRSKVFKAKMDEIAQAHLAVLHAREAVPTSGEGWKNNGHSDWT